MVSAIALLWAIPAYVETHGDYWRVGLSEGVGERMITGLQGHGASTIGWYLAGLVFYPILFWVSTLPWSPLLVIQRKKLFSGWKMDGFDVYLLLNGGLIFLVFTLMVTKLPHYTLPAFPFLALCFARRWNSVGLSPHYVTRLGWRMGVIAFALLAAGTGIPIGHHRMTRRLSSAGRACSMTRYYGIGLSFGGLAPANGIRSSSISM